MLIATIGQNLTLHVQQSRVQGSISVSNEGVFLAQFSYPEALRVESPVTEYYILISWVDR